MVGTFIAALITPPFTIGWNRLLSGSVARGAARPPVNLLAGRALGFGVAGCLIESDVLRVAVADGGRGLVRCCVDYGRPISIHEDDIAVLDLSVDQEAVRLDVTLESGLKALTLHRDPVPDGHHRMRVPLSALEVDRLCFGVTAPLAQPLLVSVWRAVIVSSAPPGPSPLAAP